MRIDEAVGLQSTQKSIYKLSIILERFHQLIYQLKNGAHSTSVQVAQLFLRWGFHFIDFDHPLDP